MRQSIMRLAYSIIAAMSRITTIAVSLPRLVVHGLYWAVDLVATPAPLRVNRESWTLVERLFSQKVSHKLNIFCTTARSTGALCSPLLS